MGVVCVVFFLPWISHAIEGKSDSGAGILELSVSIILGILIYFVVSLMLRSEEAENAKHFFKRTP